MKFTIEEIPALTIEENGKKTTYKGYSFMDEYCSCIIMVYGDSRRDLMAKYLNEKGDPLGIKYRYIKLPPSSNG